MPAQTSLRCPVCGAANPVGNTYCDQCNARLTHGVMPPSEPAPGEEAGVSGQGEEMRSGLLSQLRPSAATEAGTPADAGSGSAEPLGVPEWLQDLQPDFASQDLGDESVDLEDQYALEGEPSGDVAEAADWGTGLPEDDFGAQLVPEEPERPAAAPREPSPAFGPSEVPEWLLEMAPPEVGGRGETTEPSKPAPPQAAPAPAEIPDWLLDVAPPDVAEPAARAAEEGGLQEEPALAADAEVAPVVPDRLSEMTAGEAEPTAEWVPAPESVEPGPDEMGVPDWLDEMAVDAESLADEGAELDEIPEQVAEAVPPTEASEVPEWLRAMAAGESPAVAEAAVRSEPDLATEERAAGEEPGAQPQAAAEGGAEEVPEWLEALRPGPGAPEEAPPSALPEEPAAGIGTAQVPDWLTDLKPEGPIAEAAGTLPGGVLAGVDSGMAPAPAEIPDWLEAMRAQPPSAAAAAAEEPAETEGLLQGLRGVLPAREIEMPGPIPEKAGAEPGEAAAARAELLRSLLLPKAEKAPAGVAKKEVSAGERLVRLLVLAAIVIPVALVVGWPVVAGQGEFLVLTEPPAGSADGIYQAIDGLDTGDVALVAFEYGPGEAGELGVLARPILWHLREKGALIWVRTTRAEGQALADALRSDISATEGYTPTYQSSQYSPGGAAGVARMLSSPDGRPDIVIVLAGEMAPLQWWVEQTQALGESPPVVAAVSASTVPAASPYLGANGGSVAGLVGGLAGAAAYEDRMGDVPAPTALLLNGLAAGHLAVASLMVVGALVYAVSGASKREGR
jgi:hypothetical protein